MSAPGSSVPSRRPSPRLAPIPTSVSSCSVHHSPRRLRRELPICAPRSVNVLQSLDVEDADLAFRAIVRAAPAGLGRSARHDVFEAATVGLLQAMQRLRTVTAIARQYATCFADVFDVGLPAFEAATPAIRRSKWATLATYLGFLVSVSGHPHFAQIRFAAPPRRFGEAAALLQTSLQATDRPAALLPELLAWDAALKADGINPGTSADLTVATLFAHRLQGRLAVHAQQ